MASRKGQTKVFVTPWFGTSYKELLASHPEINDAMTTFNHCKRANPPARLPTSMKDHALKGKLQDYRECHLAPNVLLIYKHQNNTLSFLHICEHDDLEGGKAASLAARIKKALN